MWVDVEWAAHTPLSDQISKLPLESVVVITNREHPRFLQPGVVIAKSHLHLRIEFLDGTIIWMPEYWICHLKQ